MTNDHPDWSDGLLIDAPSDKEIIDTLAEALEAMRAEFRTADLPYGSRAYQMAGDALDLAQRRDDV